MFSASDTPLDLLLSRAREIDGVAVLSTALVVMGAYGVMFVAAAGSPFARAVLFKTGLFARALAHMALSREKSGWPKNRPDPAVALDVSSGDVVSVKRVIFVRHGESTWNEIFNRGFNFRFPLRLFEGLMSELLLLFTKSSFFVDSPLSDYGYEQARELRRFLRDYDGDAAGAAFDALRANRKGANRPPGQTRSPPLAARVASPTPTRWRARKAPPSSSALIYEERWRPPRWVSGDRLARTGEKIYVLSCMQEMARNVDTCALAGARECPPLHGIESKVEDINNTPMGPHDRRRQRICGGFEHAFQRREQTHRPRRFRRLAGIRRVVLGARRGVYNRRRALAVVQGVLQSVSGPRRFEKRPRRA
jgi:hypothetical protein